MTVMCELTAYVFFLADPTRILAQFFQVALCWLFCPASIRLENPLQTLVDDFEPVSVAWLRYIKKLTLPNHEVSPDFITKHSIFSTLLDEAYSVLSSQLSD